MSDGTVGYDTIDYLYQRAHLIASRLADVERFVEFVSANRTTYSYEFASILLDAGGAFASVMDAVVRAVEDKTEEAHIGAGDYWKHLRTVNKRLPVVRVDINGARNKTYPFLGLTEPRACPVWWDAFTSIKHRDATLRALGNLERGCT